jgi:hypothetical protein
MGYGEGTQAGQLRPLRGKIRKHSYASFDVETQGVENLFVMGGVAYTASNGEYVYEAFWDREKMCDFLLGSRALRGAHLIATNLDFDFTVLFYDSPRWNDFRLITRGNKIILALYKGDDGRERKFIDTLNHSPSGVARLGKIIGLGKLDMPSWMTSETGIARAPRTRKEACELAEYNMRDCEITLRWIEHHERAVNALGATNKLTISSTSVDLWRRKHQTTLIAKEEFVTAAWVTRFIRDAYYGGRTEVFARGYFERVWYYDVNSLYPTVMQEELPLPQSCVITVPCVENIKRMGVTEATVVCPDMHKPFLPYRTGEKLIFPTGRFRGTWNNCELAYAVTLGYVIEAVHRQVVYTCAWRPFASYVNELYAARKRARDAGDPGEQSIKLLMNSLYGKFGMHSVDEVDIFRINDCKSEEELAERMNGRACYDNGEGMMIATLEKEYTGKYAYPILSSYITSLARIHMYPLLNHETVIYTDTDSIMSTSPLDVAVSGGLGALKLEHDGEPAFIVRPKYYVIGDSVRIKGVMRADRNVFNQSLQGPVRMTRYSRLKESVRRGMRPNTILEVEKHLGQDDDKRVWLPSTTQNSNSQPRKVMI